ncbi:hypothetical protein SAMN04488554_1109 [Ruania alba]|uniref:DUF6318 domain-containing protein n=1 Tax=Ruania alba TaxID=648782 RepID=A0A1H5ERU4_9MICO|nr:hypothetical protein SAMN04488554_1109 [Ruania alba]
MEAPERPVEMGEETVEGAVAAAEYFVELYPYVYASGDLTEWDALSDEGCGFCSNVRERAEELHADGGYSVGGDVEVAGAQGGGPYEDDSYVVEFALTIAESEFRHADGTSTTYNEVVEPRFLVSMIWRDASWIVLGISQGEEGA